MRNAIVMVLLAGCAGGAREARLDAELGPALERGDLDAAVAAYEKLGPRREPALKLLASTAVWRSLHAPSAEERLEAARIAGGAHDPALDRELAGRLGDEDARVRAVAAAGLARDSAAARDKLREALRSTDAQVRLYALDGIDALSEAKTLGAALLDDLDPGVRAAALRRWPTGAAIERGLADASLGVRLAAVGALARDGAPAARLAALGTGADRFLALRAAVALSRIGRAADARAVVEAAAADRRPEVRSAAMNAAGELGPDARALAEPLLRDPDPGVRLDAARALVSTGHAELARPVFARLLATPLRLDAAAELARLGDADALAILDGAARTDRGALLRYASFPGAIAALVHALASDDASLRLTAAAALLRRS